MNNGKKITSFTQLDAWREGHKLVLQCYQIIRLFPREERFALSNQISRAVVSITSNVAEGFSRRSYKEKVAFYSNALGSLTEIQNQLLIARDVGYISPEKFSAIATQSVIVHKLLNGLIKKSKSIIHDS